MNIRDGERLVWVCLRCGTALIGNPRWCTACGHTIYRPTWVKEEKTG